MKKLYLYGKIQYYRLLKNIMYGRSLRCWTFWWIQVWSPPWSWHPLSLENLNRFSLIFSRVVVFKYSNIHGFSLYTCDSRYFQRKKSKILTDLMNEKYNEYDQIVKWLMEIRFGQSFHELIKFIGLLVHRIF